MAQSHVLFSIQWAAIRGVSLKLRCLPLKAIMPGRFTGILGLIFGSLFIEWYFLFFASGSAERGIQHHHDDEP